MHVKIVKTLDTLIVIISFAILCPVFMLISDVCILVDSESLLRLLLLSVDKAFVINHYIIYCGTRM